MTRIEIVTLDLRTASSSLRSAIERLVESAAASERSAAEQLFAYALDQAQLCGDTLTALLKRYGRSPTERSVDEDIGDALELRTEYAQNGRARYERMRDANLCQRCGKAPRHPGSPLCFEHREALATVRRAKASTARKVMAK